MGDGGAERPRATQDLDIFVRPSDANARRVIAALVAFGAPVAVHGVTADLFRSAGYGYRFGVKPNLVELFNVISGVDFETACTGASTIDLEGRAIPIIGRAALLANKRAAGRHKDLDDVEWLEAHPPRPPHS